MRKILLGILIGIAGVFFIVGGIAVLGSRSTSLNSSSSVTPSNDNESAESAIQVSALKLYVDYQANEVQADNVYKHRSLLVRGIVRTIRKDAFDDIIVELASPNEFEPVDAHIVQAEARQAAILQIGMLVNVLCEGDGMVIGSPQLSNCTFQADRPTPQEAKPTPTVSSDDLNTPSDAQTPPSTAAQATSSDPSSPVQADSPSTNRQQLPAPIVRQAPDQSSPSN